MFNRLSQQRFFWPATNVLIAFRRNRGKNAAAAEKSGDIRGLCELVEFPNFKQAAPSAGSAQHRSTRRRGPNAARYNSKSSMTIVVGRGAQNVDRVAEESAPHPILCVTMSTVARRAATASNTAGAQRTVAARFVERHERLIKDEQVRLDGKTPAPGRRAAACRATAGSGDGRARAARPSSSSRSRRAWRARGEGAARVTFSATVRHGRSRGSWKTTPRCSERGGGSIAPS